MAKQVRARVFCGIRSCSACADPANVVEQRATCDLIDVYMGAYHVSPRDISYAAVVTCELIVSMVCADTAASRSPAQYRSFSATRSAARSLLDCPCLACLSLFCVADARCCVDAVFGGNDRGRCARMVQRVQLAQAVSLRGRPQVSNSL